MVQTYQDSSQIQIPFSILCPVFFLRYPNRLATHVLSVDVLSREIVHRPIIRPGQAEPALASSSSSALLGGKDNDVRAVLRTTRLILKRGTLPKWAPAGIIRNAESWVLEESEVDLDGDEGRGREMRCWTRNLNHANVMAVTESNVFRETLRSSDEGNKGSSDDTAVQPTLLSSKYDVESEVGFSLLRHRIEKFGYNRVLSHVDTSRQGILLTYARFLTERKLPGLAHLVHRMDGQDGQAQFDDIVDPSRLSKRQRLLAALRPPFLDGDFIGPIARLRQRGRELRVWWKSLDRGGTADRQHMWLRTTTPEELDEQGERHLTPMERLRKRFLHLRDGVA